MSRRRHVTTRATKRAGGSEPRASRLAAVVAALSLVYVAMVLWVWVRRGAYPYELEWLEGIALEHVQRLRAGLPLYVAPSLVWVPLNYAPLYFWLCALASLAFGESFLAMRLVSMLAALAAGWAMWKLVRHETGRAAPAWLAVGLFAAAYRLGGAWLDVARADSLHLALLLLGALVARTDPSRWRMPVAAGALFALALLAKQSAFVAVGPLVLWLVFSDRPRGLVLAAVFAALSGAGLLALDAASGGWFRYYAFTVAAFHPRSLSLIWQFPVQDVLRHFAPLLALLALAARAPREPGPGSRRVFPVALAFGFLGLAWALRLYPGGYDNVLLTAHAALALLGALAFGALTARRSWRAAVAAGLMAVQLAVLGWNPAAQVPTFADRKAGDTLTSGLARLPGRVWFSSHTYLLARAGRPTHAHVMPLMDVIRDGHGPRERALLATLRDTLAAHAWNPILLDNRDWLMEECVRAGYQPVSGVFPDPQVFWPVTGMRTRPEYLFAPRAPSDSGSATAR
ncbi:MAG: glycosyltransferase family 39 protein [Candidatus Eisenbacteria bacterium]|nr:glycosyltransferase family 39 protein [Candidatus Eisenbacteria bacterium]